MLNLLLNFIIIIIFHHTSEQQTYTSSKHFYLDEGEFRNHQKATNNFRAPGQNRTHDLRILDRM